MKNQEMDSTVTSKTLQTFFIEKDKSKIFCKMEKLSEHGCMNKNCNKYAFVCQDQECQCQKQHKNCFITKIQTIIKAINGKIISIKPLEDAVNSAIDKIIEDLSDFRDKILQKMKDQFQFCGLNEDQFNILTSIRSGNVKNITGSDIQKTNISLDKQRQFMLEMKKKSLAINKTLNQLQNITTPIQKQIQNFAAFHMKYLDDNQEISITHKITKPVQKIIQSLYFKDTKIIKSFQEMGSMLYLFEPKKPAETTLLYRASQNDFCITKFHEKCDNIKNTLTLCQTTSGKIIGGYSTMDWGIHQPQPNLNSKAGYCFDESGESFMFSLTHKDKFILKEDKQSISCWKQQQKIGPSFGNRYDLVIHDKANFNFNSQINLNGSYLNEIYNLGEGKRDNKRFIGDSSENKTEMDNHFSLKEWQVWQIVFS